MLQISAHHLATLYADADLRNQVGVYINLWQTRNAEICQNTLDDHDMIHLIDCNLQEYRTQKIRRLSMHLTTDDVETLDLFSHNFSLADKQCRKRMIQVLMDESALTIDSSRKSLLRKAVVNNAVDYLLQCSDIEQIAKCVIAMDMINYNSQIELKTCKEPNKKQTALEVVQKLYTQHFDPDYKTSTTTTFHKHVAGTDVSIFSNVTIDTHNRVVIFIEKQKEEFTILDRTFMNIQLLTSNREIAVVIIFEPETRQFAVESFARCQERISDITSFLHIVRKDLEALEIPDSDECLQFTKRITKLFPKRKRKTMENIVVVE